MCGSYSGFVQSVKRRCTMLFHVTMIHAPENCPAQLPPDKQEKFFARAEEMQKAAREMNIKMHFMVGAVGHTMYALIEADTFESMNMFFSGMEFKQDYEVEPVGHVKDIIAAFRAEKGKK
jgi:muconolactone delta-isomerase